MSGIAFKKRKYLGWVILCVAFCLLIWAFPPFKVIHRRTIERQRERSEFNVVSFVDEFWTNSLLPACKTAADLREVVWLLRTNPPEAEKRFARKFGLGQRLYFFLSGRAKVVSVDAGKIAFCVDGDEKADIEIELGPIFGNTVRDGCGLLDINQFPNSQDFNMISLEINRRIETEVLPKLTDVKPGKIVTIAGCSEVDLTESSSLPLRIVPVMVVTE